MSLAHAGSLGTALNGCDASKDRIPAFVPRHEWRLASSPGVCGIRQFQSLCEAALARLPDAFESATNFDSGAKRISVVRSALAPTEEDFTPAFGGVPQDVIWLEWDYEYTTENNPTNIVFEVWWTDQLTKPFQLYAVTATKRIQVKLGKEGYFRCRASNTVTKLISEWNVKQSAQ